MDQRSPGSRQIQDVNENDVIEDFGLSTGVGVGVPDHVP